MNLIIRCISKDTVPADGVAIKNVKDSASVPILVYLDICNIISGLSEFFVS